MDVTIDIENIRKLGITVEEFLYVRNLVSEGLDIILDIEQVIRPVDTARLESLGYIKVTTTGIIPRSKALDLFNKDLADEFIGKYPIKTPSGRYLSPLRAAGKNYELIHKKFNKLVKSESMARKFIQILEAELAWRKKNDSLNYMVGIDVWLNQAYYEKMEHLLDETPDADQIAENLPDWM